MHKTLWMLLAVLLVGSTTPAEEHEHPAAPRTDDARFEFLKGLAGRWVDRSATAEATGLFEFRVTAGGTAVEEREMIGTPMEMVTLYHMDRGELVATHYCVLGNQPTLKASRELVDSTLTFGCNGTPGNAASHDEHHVHGWSMRLLDDGSLQYDAELVEHGKVTEAPSVVLVRQ